MALPGISNGNEFYSAHYLESVLSSDIKKVKQRWAEEAKAELESNPLAEVSTPEQQFRALRKPWQKLREAELGIRNVPAERLRLQRELFFQPLLQALGYPIHPHAEPVLIGGEAYQIPLLGEVRNGKDEPWLWVVECFNPSDEAADPLELTIATNWACQIEDPSLGTVHDSETWEELISERVFGQDTPPRWVLAVSRDQLLLIDRQKWAASRLLRFELDSLLGDNNADALLAAATLLHREHTCPTNGGTPYLDELDENSHKHAYEVSGDLKYALRKSIELIGNEAIHWRRSRNEGVFKGKTDADQLTLECLRYMYRLLFLFYIESRPDLGYAPMGSDVYRLGYSLESLREMDTTELGSEEDKESTYISDSLDRLFQMIWEGYPKRDDPTAQLTLADGDETFHDSFRLTPLRAHLFDPERLPTLRKVRFRNVVLREVIELMSLTKEGKGKRRGRVSYSQLGINQLGAVYEALLSFRGFFAEEDLFEVQPAPKKGKAAKASDNDGDDEDGDDANSAKASGAAHDELEVGHFVTAEQLKAYKPEEIVPDQDTGNPKCYAKGSFIYRLAGRDREKSASYYTPESLTQCLVKYALKELLPGKTASEILELKVCEPAMGSAAFLNEVVNQLAQAYVEMRQQETGKSIPHEQFATELQKIKMRLADQNVFGVDLNPVAVELAEVSLWLNSIFTPEKGRAFVPWFSQQLVCGNSLIGARRQIYRVNQLPTSNARSAKPSKLWHEHAPEELAWDAELPDDGIFHFLLPDPGMAAYTDKVIKQLEPEAIERCKKWNKAFVGEVFTESQIAHLQRLSKLVDSLWKDWAGQQQQLRERTTDPLPVWEDPTGAEEGDWTPLLLKDRIQEQEVQGRDVANTNARLRLKWAMDYWAALWFWPISEAGSLPSRDTWLLELSMILGDLEQGITPELGQGNLFADTQPKQLAADFSDRHGFVDINKLTQEFKSLSITKKIASELRPIHWELEFADLMRTGGFDLVIGNPPWAKTEWKGSHFLSEVDPSIQIRKLPASESNSLTEKILSNTQTREEYKREFATVNGSKRITTSQTLFPIVAAQTNNISKNFIELSWRLAGDGITALIHPFGIFDDSRGHKARKKAYHKLTHLLHFRNELNLFDILHTREFTLCIYGKERKEIEFNAAFTLFHPKTYDECYVNDYSKDLPLPKDKDGKWNTQGHPDRKIRVDKDFLNNISEESKGDFLATSLSKPYSLTGAQISQKITTNGSLVGHIKGFKTTLGLGENSAQVNNIIVKKSYFPEEGSFTILTGSNIHICNPLYKSAKEICTHPLHYTPIRLNSSEYLSPRTLYQQIGSSENIKKLDPLSDQYRVSLPRQIDTGTERTLQPCIMPPSWTHIDGIISFKFESIIDTLAACGYLSSLPYDFLIRSKGLSNFLKGDLETIRFPMGNKKIKSNVALRVLLLNCVNSHFDKLMSDAVYNLSTLLQTKSSLEALLEISQVSVDIQSIIAVGTYGKYIRLTDWERHNLLAEIDVLTAVACEISEEDLQKILHEGFQLSNKYSSETYFDKSGFIARTSNRGLPGVGIQEKPNKYCDITWRNVSALEIGSIEYIYEDDSAEGGSSLRTWDYTAPFKSFSKKEKYAEFWEKAERIGRA